MKLIALALVLVAHLGWGSANPANADPVVVAVGTARITVTEFKPDRPDKPGDAATTTTSIIEIADTFTDSEKDAYDYHVEFKLVGFNQTPVIFENAKEPFDTFDRIKIKNGVFTASWTKKTAVKKNAPIEIAFDVQIPIAFSKTKVEVISTYWTDIAHNSISAIPEPSSTCLLVCGLTVLGLVRHRRAGSCLAP